MYFLTVVYQFTEIQLGAEAHKKILVFKSGSIYKRRLTFFDKGDIDFP